jgi:pimeloyl-ACP methyl ester carboxylesterase
LIALSGRGQFHGVTPRLLPTLIHPDRLGETDLVRTITDMADAVGRDGFLRQETAILARPDGRADLARIVVPTLILCGRQDLLTPLELHEEMAALIPNARPAVVEHCGHMTTLEQPDAVNAAMREWLLT